ncbi:MAG TPA: HipA N-terminal domain-containing protein, partial [Cellvibrionaceae bacterium]|nr:HipA N-terminal domain-containing protein [Cellvibrionaceae bacterium]
MSLDVISVNYLGKTVGAASFDTQTGLGAFEYTAEFLDTGIELSPLKMPLAKRIYTFPELDHATFKGLPGLLADSLPDDFGNAVLNAWMASKGKQ